MAGRYPLALVLAALIAVAGVGAGCGESDEDKFSDEYKPLNDDLLQLGRDLADTLRTVRGMTPQEASAEFNDMADELDKISGELADLEPPEDLQGDLDDLTGGLEDAADASEDVAAAVRTNDVEAARTSTTELVRVSEEINRAQNKLAEETGAEKGRS